MELLLAEWPNDAQKAAAFSQKAECYEKLGDATAALHAYRLAFDAQRGKPSEITTAHLGFGLLVALSPYPDSYDEALSVLEDFGSSSFPIEEFQTAIIRALIADATGHRKEVSRQSQLAFAAADKKYSGFVRHAQLGLVAEIPPHLEDRLKRMAQSGK